MQGRPQRTHVLCGVFFALMPGCLLPPGLCMSFATAPRFANQVTPPTPSPSQCAPLYRRTSTGCERCATGAWINLGVVLWAVFPVSLFIMICLLVRSILLLPMLFFHAALSILHAYWPQVYYCAQRREKLKDKFDDTQLAKDSRASVTEIYKKAGSGVREKLKVK